MGDLGLYPCIQSSILGIIRQPTFEATLPPLSEERWSKLLSDDKYTRRENDRMEFMGDALMYAVIGRLLYEQIPDGTPHLYTVSRRSLRCAPCSQRRQSLQK